jgi:hypothetical protein
MSKIIIAGDFFISDPYKGSELISEELQQHFASVEHVIVNLEAPILNERSQSNITKTGPSLQMLAKVINPLFQEFKISIVTLANNHIFDFGINGLKDTIENLNSSSIRKVGAGMSEKDIQEELIILLSNGIKVAIINFCENEFSTLSKSNAGANPYNLINNCKKILETKLVVDKVICIVHGGHEYIDVPSPRMINAFRTLVDFGADAVLCHHAHCISTYETYKNAPIFYGLGNFLFTLPSKHECWYTGLVVELEILRDEPIKFDFKILSQDKKNFSVGFSPESITKSVMARINELSVSLKTPNELQNLWKSEIFALKDEYLSLLSPSGSFSSKWLISFFWRTKLFRRLFTLNYTAILLNMLRCEAHRDALELILKQKLNDRNT